MLQQKLESAKGNVAALMTAVSRALLSFLLVGCASASLTPAPRPPDSWDGWWKIESTTSDTPGSPFFEPGTTLRLRGDELQSVVVGEGIVEVLALRAIEGSRWQYGPAMTLERSPKGLTLTFVPRFYSRRAPVLLTLLPASSTEAEEAEHELAKHGARAAVCGLAAACVDVAIDELGLKREGRLDERSLRFCEEMLDNIASRYAMKHRPPSAACSDGCLLVPPRPAARAFCRRGE